MKTISLMIVTAMLATSLAGCVVRTRSTGRASTVHRRDCPPAYHWDGGACVHNGRGHAKGHRK